MSRVLIGGIKVFKKNQFCAWSERGQEAVNQEKFLSIMNSLYFCWIGTKYSLFEYALNLLQMFWKLDVLIKKYVKRGGGGVVIVLTLFIRGISLPLSVVSSCVYIFKCHMFLNWYIHFKEKRKNCQKKNVSPLKAFFCP